MDAASSIELVGQKAEISKQQFRDILDDPKKTLYFMIAVAVTGAFLFVIVNTISDIFTANSEVKKFQQPTKQEEIKKPSFDSKRKTDIAYLKNMIDRYHAKNGAYPQSLSNLVPQFTAKIPFDPTTQRQYSYRVSLDYKSYEVWAILDDGQEYLLSD